VHLDAEFPAGAIDLRDAIVLAQLFSKPIGSSR
jgi:hypothetical protein